MKTSANTRSRYSRRALNTIIILTACLILFFSNFDGEKKAQVREAQTPQSEASARQSKDPVEFSIDRLRARFHSLNEVPLALVEQSAYDVEHWVNTKGASVYFVAAPQIPMLDIRLTFDAGSARDAGLPGLAHLTNDLLMQGTETRSASELFGAFESLGIEYSVNAYRDMAVLSFRMLNQPQYLEAALDLIAEVIAKPKFAEADVVRFINTYRLALEREKQSPGATMSQGFFSHLYPQHPYGSHPGGSLESLNVLSSDDLVQFHQAYYVAANLVIAMVGAVSNEKAKEISERLTRSLNTGEAAAALVPPKPTVKRRKHIPFTSAQTHVRVATTLNIGLDDVDYYPLYVANHILGGSGFSSILNQKIRQAEGLAYSVYSSLRPMAASGPFFIALQTQAESTAVALEIVDEVINNFLVDGPSEDELVVAKQQIMASFPLRAANNASVVGYLSSIGFYGLSLDYLNHFNQKIDAVTQAQVRDALRRNLDPKNFLVLTLGPDLDQ